jgi:hypothetical protein
LVSAVSLNGKGIAAKRGFMRPRLIRIPTLPRLCPPSWDVRRYLNAAIGAPSQSTSVEAFTSGSI